MFKTQWLSLVEESMTFELDAKEKMSGTNCNQSNTIRQHKRPMKSRQTPQLMRKRILTSLIEDNSDESSWELGNCIFPKLSSEKPLLCSFGNWQLRWDLSIWKLRQPSDPFSSTQSTSKMPANIFLFQNFPKKTSFTSLVANATCKPM